MNEEIEFIVDSAKEQMQGTIDFLIKELRSIRAGKASPSMLANIMVDYYGSQTPLGQVANVNTPDARTISIQPWEKQMLTEIEKAIMKANIGFNPMNNGENLSLIHISEPTRQAEISYAVFCLKKKKKITHIYKITYQTNYSYIQQLQTYPNTYSTTTINLL